MLGKGKRGPALRNRLVGDAEMHQGLLNQEPLRAERRWSQVFQGYLETPLHQRSSECVPLEIVSVPPCKKRKYRDGQVDRQVLTALEALERCLDGHVFFVSTMSEEKAVLR